VQQFALLVVEFFRHDNLDNNELVTPAVGAQDRHAFALDPEHLSVLGAGLKTDPFRAVHGRHFDLCAQCCLHDVDGQLQHDVVLLALEHRMRPDR